MVYTRKRNSKKSASKRNGKSKTLRKKKSRKNLKKKVTGGFSFSLPSRSMGKTKYFIPKKIAKGLYEEMENHKDKDSKEFKRLVKVNNPSQINNIKNNKWPSELQYVIQTGPVSDSGTDVIALKDDEVENVFKKLEKKFLEQAMVDGKRKNFYSVKINDEGNFVINENFDNEIAEAEAKIQAEIQEEAEREAKEAEERAADIKARKAERKAKEAEERAAMIAAESPEETVARETREAEKIAEKEATAKATAASNERMRQLRMKNAACQKKCTESGQTGANMTVCRATCNK